MLVSIKIHFSLQTIDGIHQTGSWGYCDTGRGSDCGNNGLKIDSIITAASNDPSKTEKYPSGEL